MTKVMVNYQIPTAKGVLQGTAFMTLHPGLTEDAVKAAMQTLADDFDQAFIANKAPKRMGPVIIAFLLRLDEDVEIPKTLRVIDASEDPAGRAGSDTGTVPGKQTE